jgi:dihydroorotase
MEGIEDGGVMFLRNAGMYLQVHGVVTQTNIDIFTAMRTQS